MNVLSLFDGMSCGQIALERAGIKVDKYFASEIESAPIKVTQHNYPNTIQLGDVTKWREWDLPKIDLLIGGSPCQDFSTLKFERDGLNGSKSKLFYEFLNVLKAVNPKYWMLENVKMKVDSKKQLDDYLGVEGVLIDSNNFVAQNRKRYYWTNIDIEEISERDFLLDDILEQSVPDKYKCKEHQVLHYDNCKYIQNGETVEVIDFYNKNIKYRNANCITPHAFRCDRSATNIVKVDGELRKLTENECEKLQTVLVNYTDMVSSGHRYKMLGNGWTVDVIAHIFKGLKQHQGG